MNVSREDKKKEAVRRMRKMGIFEGTIKQFEKDDFVSISYPPFGAFYWAEDEDLKRIKEFEEKHNALVYVVIRSFTTIGKMDSMIFVSDYPEEWEYDEEDMIDKLAMAYVFNHDYPDCSEQGTIGWEMTVAGGLVRTV